MLKKHGDLGCVTTGRRMTDLYFKYDGMTECIINAKKEERGCSYEM